MTNESLDTPVRAVRWVGKSAVVDVVGDVDLNRSPRLQAALLKLLDKSPSRIVVNLAGVGYMDSSGVASLVKLLSRTRKMGLSLSLVGVDGRVRSVFEITRLDRIFNIFDTEEEALA